MSRADLNTVDGQPDAEYVASYYAASVQYQRRYPRLEGEAQADVAILGGGFTGVNAALELAGRGYSVALLEARRVGWGCSGRNGGQVIIGMANYSRLRRNLGEDSAREVWRMGVEGMDIIYDRVQKFDIQCDLARGYFEAACNRRQYRDVLEELEQRKTLGYPHQVRLVPRDELASVISSQAYVGGLSDTGCGHLHPLNLCLGEAQAAAELGVRIYECSPVTKVQSGNAPALVTAHGTLRAKFVVIAGNAYLEGIVPGLRGYVLPAGSYIIATEPLSEEVAHSLLPGNHAVCDLNTLLDYYRLSADRRLLFGGRCNFSGRRPHNIQGVLMPRMLKVFPQLRGVRIDYEWGGNVAVSLNRIPQFGRLHGNVFYAQGYTGHGVVPTHMAGRLLAEVIAGQAERFDLLSRIKHWRMPGGKWLGGPALAFGMMYYRLKDLL